SYSKPAQSPFPMYRPKLKMERIEEVGTYAFKVDWNDGHNAGIYSYEYLRRICPCPECEAARREGRL
ncbi:MAG: gamma-butyrobetaine hydroxylase-like domain-containing protein, partial [Bryobacteraceae bacterium]